MALSALLTLLAWAPGAAACVLRIAWNEFPPYQFEARDGGPDGIDIRLAEEAARRMGCDIDWRKLPRQRSLILLRLGHVDAQSGMSWTPERAEFAHYSQSMRHGINALFVRKGSAARWPFGGLTALAASGFRLGAQGGTKYSAEFEHLVREGRFAAGLTMAQSTENAVQMLLNDRIDGFFDGQLTGRWELARLGLDGRVEEHPGISIIGEAFMIFSRASVDPALVASFDAAIASMREDGSHALIMAEGERLGPADAAPIPLP